MRHRPLIAALSCLALVACVDRDNDSAARSGSQGGIVSKPARDSASSAPGRPATATPQMQAVLDEMVSLGGKPIETLSPTEARRQPTPADAVKSLLRKQGRSTAPEAVAKVEDIIVPGAAGGLPGRVYTPEGTGPFPVLLYFHGGGWVIASTEVYEASPRALANAAKCVVLAIDYRLAPEHKFPAAHDDAIASYRWLLDNAASIQGDPRRIAVAGESAGGNLAANVAIAARDQGLRAPVHELLVYPVADTDVQAPSFIENAQAKPLNAAMMGWFGDNYFRTSADARDPRIALVAANLAGLPPTTIVAAQIDPLRSGGELLAQRLKAAGCDVERRQYDGVTHEFFGMGPAVDEARQAVGYAAKRLIESFGE